MRSRCMSLLPRTTLHSDSEQYHSLFFYHSAIILVHFFLSPLNQINPILTVCSKSVLKIPFFFHSRSWSLEPTSLGEQVLFRWFYRNSCLQRLPLNSYHSHYSYQFCYYYYFNYLSWLNYFGSFLLWCDSSPKLLRN
jgi:hypothetical protein